MNNIYVSGSIKKVMILALLLMPIKVYALTQDQFCNDLSSKTASGIMMYKISGRSESEVRSMTAKAVAEMRVESADAPKVLGIPKYFELLDLSMDLVITTTYFDADITQEKRKMIIKELCLGPKISSYF
jgi:hypothetical protein